MRASFGFPVMGVKEMDEMRDEAAGQSRRNGDIFSLVEIKFGCTDHPDAGMDVFYEDGLIVLLCQTCGVNKGQIEIAEEGRIWPMEYTN